MRYMMFSGALAVGRRLLDPGPQPLAQGRGLLEEAERQQGVDGERGVTNPRVAVVPVPLAARPVRAAHRSVPPRGRPWGIGHQLEGDGRAVHRLPPAPPVGPLLDPAVPELHGVVEEAEQLAVTDRRRGALRSGLEHEHAQLVGPDRDARPHVVAVGLERPGGHQVEVQDVALEAGRRPVDLGAVRLAGVVEAWLDPYVERDLPAHPPDPSDQSTMVAGLPRLVVERHQVEDLGDPGLRQVAGDEHGGVGQVHLLGHRVVTDRGDGEPPALLVVQQGGEHGRRIEARTAEPIHRAVGRDQRRSLEISDQAVLGDRWIAHVRPSIRDAGTGSSRRASAGRPGPPRWSPEPTVRARPAASSRMDDPLPGRHG